MKEQGTQTSSFGAPAKINHNSAKIYNSRLVMKISDNKKKAFVLIMTRKKIVLPDDSIQKKNRKLSKYIGAGKGISGSPKEVDKFSLPQTTQRMGLKEKLEVHS